MTKPKVAAFGAASCGGCDIAMLEIQEHILELVAAVDIVFWPTIADLKYSDLEAMEDGSIALTLFNGAIRTEENAEVARLLRAKSRVLVAFGACASFGGVVGLGDLPGTEALLERAFSTESTDPAPVPRPAPLDAETAGVPAMLPRVLPLASVVPVDYTMPGCPPAPDRVWEVLTGFLAGTLPAPPAVAGVTGRSVCEECSLPKRNTRVSAFRRFHQVVPEPDWCLLEQGIVCMGPATASGCGAQCTTVGMPCRGCYGPAGDARDAGAKMVAALGALIDSEDEEEIVRIVGTVTDPAGIFYGFTLADSILGSSGALPRSRAGEGGA